MFLYVCLSCMLLFDLLCLDNFSIISLCFCSNWKRGWSITQLCCRELSIGQIRLWCGVGVVGLTIFCLRCWINIIFTPVSLWYLHHWNACVIFVYLFYFFLSNFLLDKHKIHTRFTVLSTSLKCIGYFVYLLRFSFQTLKQGILDFTRFNVISTSPKCIWYFCIFAFFLPFKLSARLT